MGCGQQISDVNIDEIKLFQEKIEYPYSASEEREEVILANMNKLKKGMIKNQVVGLLTAPDEVNLTYRFPNAKSKDNIVGFSLVYVLRRNVESGSVVEKNEKLLRIHFDSSGRLVWSYSSDIEGFKAIEKA